VRLALALLIAGCGAPAAPATPASNQGGRTAAATTADGSLRGPFASLADLAEASYYPRDATVITLGSAGRVALRELRSSVTGASCLVTIETAQGIFAGEAFLCAADRSDESASTDAVRVVVDGDAATVRFRVRYQLDGQLPEVGEHAITCALAPHLTCSDPPRIGGYE
jgi:hypothetical protein